MDVDGCQAADGSTVGAQLFEDVQTIAGANSEVDGHLLAAGSTRLPADAVPVSFAVDADDALNIAGLKKVGFWP